MADAVASGVFGQVEPLIAAVDKVLPRFVLYIFGGSQADGNIAEGMPLTGYRQVGNLRREWGIEHTTLQTEPESYRGVDG